VIDPEASFEESNGESRPLTEAEYAGNEYRACPDHPRAGTQVLDIGGEGRPQLQGCAVCKRTDYQDVPYAEYLRYYGDPERHVYLGAIVEKRCSCCGLWKSVESLWHIDMMDDDRGLQQVTVGELGSKQAREYLTPEQATALDGYLGELSRELLEEAEAEPEKAEPEPSGDDEEVSS
jgi:hypothetical protein